MISLEPVVRSYKRMHLVKMTALFQKIYGDCNIPIHLRMSAERSTRPYQRSLPTPRTRPRPPMSSPASSPPDPTVAVSCGFTLQICLTTALPPPCRRWRPGFASGQASLAWSIALRTQEPHTRPRVPKERRLEERTGSSSLNLLQAVFTRAVAESPQPPAAESTPPRYQKEATTSSLPGPTWTLPPRGPPSKGRAAPRHRVHPQSGSPAMRPSPPHLP